jgi:hypothetical protein
MAQDRSLDRHRTINYPYRPMPPELLERVDNALGPGRRSWLISRLLTAFLDGKQMPYVGEVLEELDKLGQDRGA